MQKYNYHQRNYNFTFRFGVNVEVSDAIDPVVVLFIGGGFVHVINKNYNNKFLELPMIQCQLKLLTQKYPIQY